MSVLNEKICVFIKKICDFINLVNPWLTFIASGIAIVVFLTIYSTYFNPYIVSSKTYMEYTPEDYLLHSGLETPDYVLKTTKIISLKPQSFLGYKNYKSFSLPSDSFDIKYTLTDNYEVKKVDNNKIIFYFTKKRSSIENVEISYSYKQNRNPHVLILDYSGIIGADTIEENLILENTENAKIKLFRANWFVNNDNKSWSNENILNRPNSIFIEENEIIPRFNYAILDDINVLIYSWDINFEENEIKSIKVLTNTNANYSTYSVDTEYIRPSSIDIEFPFEKDNFEWVCLGYFNPNFPYPNTIGYVNRTSFQNFCIPWNATEYRLIEEKKRIEGKILEKDLNYHNE